MRASQHFSLLISFAITPAIAIAQESVTDTRPSIAPDIREDDTKLKLQRGDVVIVPIPISNPTLGSGLVLGGAYFYSQTEEQKKTQPASVTGAAGVYTDNNSRAFTLIQQNYWNQNKWRFTGAAGAADLRLSLIAPEDVSTSSVDWRIRGEFVFARLSRKISGNWYGGGTLRFADIAQDIETTVQSNDFDTSPDVRAAGLGATVEYDSRDMPLNSYSGRYFKVETLFNDEAVGSSQTYQSYNLAYNSYHAVADNLTVAWEFQGCQRVGGAPLWDACRINLRGFAATDYLGKVSTSAQIEARWRVSERWGLVGFAGAGQVSRSFSESEDRSLIPSYGVGLRFMVSKAKRVNMRLDFARSQDSDAIHFSVGEAF
ncbi:BamA/TamA family outer membrane protein [Congregibacter brevis]|uniref:BamA/TamA family outer membrane protein n=1 Tax=Congregibacter brevis TaxID=3081201 RepID=A0ABZ0IE03_9GAMM|nr:BamA/TamA family outer membrane protein [Congregibacter sp. IMCC45268]